VTTSRIAHSINKIQNTPTIRQGGIQAVADVSTASLTDYQIELLTQFQVQTILSPILPEKSLKKITGRICCHSGVAPVTGNRWRLSLI